MSSEVVYEEVDDDQEEARQALMSLKKASSNLEEKMGNKRKGSGRGRDGDSSLNYSASYMRDRSRMDEDNKYFIWTSKTGETKLISALEQKLLAAEELVKKRKLEEKISSVLFIPTWCIACTGRECVKQAMRSTPIRRLTAGPRLGL